VAERVEDAALVAHRQVLDVGDVRGLAHLVRAKHPRPEHIRRPHRNYGITTGPAHGQVTFLGRYSSTQHAHFDTGALQ